jgi:hypothetical protein
MSRAHIVALFVCFIAAESAAAADVGAMIVPSACFVHSASADQKARTIDRIELQFMQVIAKDRTPIGGIRVQLGIQPKDGDDIIPSGLSAPCSGVGRKLSCTLTCDDSNKRSRLGRFRTEHAGDDRLRLIIETPLVLNACSPEEKPHTIRRSLVGQTFVLRLENSGNCFH